MEPRIEPENGISGVQSAVENSKATRTFKRISRLKGQKRIDALIELLYSAEADILIGDQYKKLALPEMDVISALYESSSSNRTFKWPSEPLETRWRCFHLGTSYPALAPDAFASEDIADYLEDSLSEERLTELRNGAPFSDEEWEQVSQREDLVQYDSGSAVVSFQTKDKLGRSMYFVSEFGDWGTYLSSSGPYSDDQDLVDCSQNFDGYIFEGASEAWQAETPNWDDEPDEYEEFAWGWDDVF